MKFSLKTLIWGTLAIALAISIFFFLSPQRVEVEVASVVRGPLKVTVREDGKTRIREKYIVSAPVAGRLSRIELEAGDYCSEATLLAVILPSDPALLDARARAEATARLRAAEAALQRAASSGEQARIARELSQAKYERAERLLPNAAISAEEFDIVKSEYLASTQAIKTAKFDEEIAAFELEMAKAAVEQFAETDEQQNASPFEIFAPISGRVLRVFEESSTVVAVGEPLIELGDPQDLEIEVDVLSTDAVRIKPGAELRVEHWGGKSSLRGHVRLVEPQAFTKVSSLGVEEQRVFIVGDFDAPPGGVGPLGDGYRIEAVITVESVDSALLVPNSSLFRHNRQWHVLRNAEGRASMQPVTIGLQNDSHTQVLDGLEEGQQVIVYPSDTLAPGSRITAKPQSETDNTPTAE